MPNFRKLTKPKQGDPVDGLWRHVALLVDEMERVRSELNSLKASLAQRRKFGESSIYIKCCLEDASVCYVPILIGGEPVRTIAGDAEAIVIDEAAVMPAGQIYLE
jgi:hypothetical protein